MSAVPAMSPEDYVDALYRLCLGREPDAEGRATWVAALQASGDPTLVLAEMLKSDEHLEHMTTPGYLELIDEALQRLARRNSIEIANPQTLSDETLLETKGNGVYRDARSFLPALFGPPERVHIHPTVILNDALINTTSGEVTIDEHAFFGHRVMILAARHDVTKAGAERQTAIPQTGCDIHIGAGAWIASGAMILGPCRVGTNAVVGAGSVVTTDIPPNAVAVGSPARVISQIDLDKTNE